VLQTTTVFVNVSKGVLAKHEDLVDVFGTADEEQVCRLILAEGDTQARSRSRPPRLSLGVGKPHPQVCLLTLLSKASWQRGAPPLRSGRAKLQCRAHEGPSPAACMESGSMQISLCSSVVPRWRCMRCTAGVVVVVHDCARLKHVQLRRPARPRAPALTGSASRSCRRSAGARPQRDSVPPQWGPATGPHYCMGLRLPGPSPTPSPNPTTARAARSRTRSASWSLPRCSRTWRACWRTSASTRTRSARTRCPWSSARCATCTSLWTPSAAPNSRRCRRAGRAAQGTLHIAVSCRAAAASLDAEAPACLPGRPACFDHRLALLMLARPGWV